MATLLNAVYYLISVVRILVEDSERLDKEKVSRKLDEWSGEIRGHFTD